MTLRHRLGCFLFLLGLAGTAWWIMPADAQVPTAPPGFTVTLVADSLPATSAIAIAPASFGAHTGDLFLAAGSTNSVMRVTPGGQVSIFATGVANDPTELSFGPGGSFGTDLYVSSNQDAGALAYGTMWRVGPSGLVAYFGTQTPPSPPTYKLGSGGIAFSAGGAFGVSLYTGASAGDAGDCISRMGSGGGPAQFFGLLTGVGGGLSYGLPSGLQFGPGVAGFGTDLYCGYWHTESSPGLASGIYKLDSSGGRSTFSPVFHPGEIEFGPGGSFGTDLYVVETDDHGGPGRILRLDSTGAATVFVSGITGGAFGLAFADTSALYFNASDSGKVYRVVPKSVAAVASGSDGQLLGMSAGPNPFARAVSLGWSQGREADAALSIHEIGGRLIRQVFSGPSGPGPHRVEWDGTDDAGRRVGAGVYIATLVAGDRKGALRVVLVR